METFLLLCEVFEILLMDLLTQGLQSYIRTLPAEEEVRELRAKLEARTGQQAEAEVKLTDSEAAAKQLRKDLMAAERERLKLEIENKELVERNREMGRR